MLEFVFLIKSDSFTVMLIHAWKCIRKDEQEIGMELGSGGLVGRECLLPCVFRGFFLYREVLFYKEVKK